MRLIFSVWPVVRLIELRVLLQRAVHHLEIGLFAERVRDRLEHEQARRALRRRLHRRRLAVGADNRLFAAVDRRSEGRGDIIQQRAQTREVDRRPAEHGRDVARAQAAVERRLHLLGGERLLGEELFHQLLARLGQRFEDHRLIAGHFFFIGVGQRHGRARARFVEGVSLFLQQVIISRLRALSVGHDDRADALAEFLAQGLEHRIEVGVLVVHLVDEKRLGDARGGVPRQLGADLYAALGLKHDDRAAGHGDGLLHFAGEVEVARRIQKVYFFALPLEMRKRSREREASFDLFRVKVADGVAVRNLAESVRCLCKIKHRLGDRRFSVPAMTEQANVSYRVRRKFSHQNKPPS